LSNFNFLIIGMWYVVVVKSNLSRWSFWLSFASSHVGGVP
jgi:hypothetical protein